MEQAQRLAHVLHAGRAPDRRGDAAAARLPATSRTTRSRSTGSRTRATGSSREAIASLFDARHRPDGRDPLEGHLRAARGGDRRDRARRQHPRGHRHQERAEPCTPTLILVIVVATALAFDFTNGFHDTANVVATSISTRAHVAARWRSRIAVDAELRRRVHLAEGRRDDRHGHRRPERGDDDVVFAGLVGAIAWNLVTWYFGLPSSSSHALIGGIVGRDARRQRARARSTSSGLVDKVIVPALIAPVLAFAVGRARDPRRLPRSSAGCARAPSSAASALGQLLSGGLLALAHGTNDAQKTMGVITLALVANGNLAANDFDVPTWVVISLGDGDRARHLHRRLADHPDDGQPDHQDGPGAGLRRPGRAARR